MKPSRFKIYLDKLNNKIFPIWCNVNFVSVFTALNNTNNKKKINIPPYGENFHQLTYWDKIKKNNKIKSGGLHFLKVFATLNFGMVYQFSRNRQFTMRALR